MLISVLLNDDDPIEIGKEQHIDYLSNSEGVTGSSLCNWTVSSYIRLHDDIVLHAKLSCCQLQVYVPLIFPFHNFP